MLYVPGVLADADDAFRRLDYDRAAEILIELLLIDPDNERARLRLHGVIARKWTHAPPGRLKRRISRLKIRLLLHYRKKPNARFYPLMRHLCDDPFDHRMRTELAAALSSRAQWRACAAEARIVFEADPGNLKAGRLLAEALLTLGLREEASTVLGRLVQIHGETDDLLKIQRSILARTCCFPPSPADQSYRADAHHG